MKLGKAPEIVEVRGTLRQKHIGRFELLTNGLTVWVNTGEAGAIARFGRQRMDIHNAENTACAHCGAPSWRIFIKQMKEVHGLEIPEDFRPSWCLY